jgi:hypothetical protein
LRFEIPESESDKECAEAKGGPSRPRVIILVNMVVRAAFMPLFGENEAAPTEEPGRFSKDGLAAKRCQRLCFREVYRMDGDTQLFELARVLT